ncbi:cyclase family protein [Prosthecomicrobium pneumaticum]|uniref:Kynurenine formamidase n=1 Tax=Prosthecomicrobium pneumaticum TaxID=81895 RepID=A0A7W9FQX2_9HYPH|nr:cyclase family protein [Prosthecomicrobium pneumaticum]MBB5755111.1 kynurenine formamidase [Prosthecomicrobium pneumaticum]
MNAWSLENWYPSRFGADDVIGALNLVTPQTVKAAFGLVKKGVIYDLSFVMEQDMPIPSFHGSFFANTQYSLENGAEWHHLAMDRMTNGFSAQNLRLAISDHSGTHIDQLNHVGEQQADGDFLLYNGIRNKDVISTFGTSKLGIETMPPMIARGVLIDVAGHKGVDMLPPGYAIQPEELDAVLAAQGTVVKEGDVVLVHTGWARNWRQPKKMMEGEPGLGKACAEWAIGKNIICWGLDQFATDPVPYETPGEALPMHIAMLTKAGIRLMENVNMAPIVDEKVYEFMVIAAPLKIRGATGSPIRLIALV